MKYKTYDENDLKDLKFLLTTITIFLIFFAILIVCTSIWSAEYDKTWYTETVWDVLIWIIVFVVHIPYFKDFKIVNKRFKQYKKIIWEGTRYNGVITKADHHYYRRLKPDAYYMYVDFTDEKGDEKTFITPPYCGDLNYYLNDNKCSVYKLDGKYAIADLCERPFWDYFKFFYIEERIKTEESKFREHIDNTEGEIRIYQKR